MVQLLSGASALLFALSLVACQPSGEFAEIVNKLDEIDKKIASIDTKIDNLPARGAAARPREDPNKIYRIAVGNAPIKGNPDAPVTIVEYSDFQCPFCARSQPLLTRVMEKYPDDVRLVYKHFPLSFHKAAKPAAVASMAAQEQGKFWEMHDVLFAKGAKINEAKIEAYAEEAGLDMDRFRADYADKKAAYEKLVDADLRQGQSVAVRGTPTLYINGKKVQQRSFEGMNAMIDAALAESKKQKKDS